MNKRFLIKTIFNLFQANHLFLIFPLKMSESCSSHKNVTVDRKSYPKKLVGKISSFPYSSFYHSQTWLSIKKPRKFVKQTLCFLFILYTKYIYIYIHNIWNKEIRNKTSGKIYMKTKYEIFLQWNTKFFSWESSLSSTFWILPKLYELCESCRRISLETL